MLTQVVVTWFQKYAFSLLYFILDDGSEEKAAVNTSSTASDAFAPLSCAGKEADQTCRNGLAYCDCPGNIGIALTASLCVTLGRVSTLIFPLSAQSGKQYWF